MSARIRVDTASALAHDVTLVVSPAMKTEKPCDLPRFFDVFNVLPAREILLKWHSRAIVSCCLETRHLQHIL